MAIALLLLLPMVLLVFDSFTSSDQEDAPEPEADIIEEIAQEVDTDFLDSFEPEPEPADDARLVVPEGLFQANAVYSVHTDQGSLTETFTDAIDAFDLEALRFPAGQAEFGEGDTEGQDWLDITQLTDDGALRPELTSFLDEFGGDVMLTIPTTNAAVSDYGDTLETWTELVMRDYGDMITSFEIGNEYWSFMDETEYGQKANIAVQALARGIEAADAEDADIIVQMGSVYNESEFSSARDGRGFIDRLTDANQTIIDQFDPEALDEINGVVDHYYWNRSPIPFEDTSGEVRYMDIKFEVWQDNFDQPLDFHVTEWNLKMGNCPCNGLRSMAVLTEMVENMVELGVDSAYVWPLIHNATNDLGGPADDGSVNTDDQGRVTETLRGAVFDLMSEELPGKALIDVDVPGVHNDMEIAAYEKEGEYAFYLGSHSTVTENFTVDLSDLIPNFTSAEGVQVGYDRATSDGRYYKPGVGRVDATSVKINGEDYFLDEHDVEAELTDYAYDSPIFNVQLNPYEVIQITAR